MNRRDIMKLLGLGAAALPTASATGAIIPPTVAPLPEPVVEHPLHKMFRDPLTAYVHMKDGSVHGVMAIRHSDTHRVRVSVRIDFTGLMSKIVLKRGAVELITLGPENMNTPYCVLGSTIEIDIVGHL